MAKQQGYRDLKAWQLAMEIAEQVLELCESFPKSVQFSLVTQVQRAAISVPSNIAEGYSRQSRKEFAQFLFIARGSLSEMETQLILATKRKYLSREKMSVLWDQLQELGRILNGLIKSAQGRK